MSSVAVMVQVVNQYLSSGKHHSLLALAKGFRNGAVYGSKIRFPHALVMTLLFRGGPLREQARAILEATFTHSKNLASFVFTYKALTSLMRHLDTSQKQYHSFIAAFIGGYLVFGKYNKVNEQINLYLLSRVLYGLIKLGAQRGYISTPRSDPFPLFAAVVWGLVLWMFEYHRSTLQPSLQASMTYLYDDSNRWHGLRDFLLYNK